MLENKRSECFNSIKVQLILINIFFIFISIWRFNSIKVQLIPWFFNQGYKWLSITYSLQRYYFFIKKLSISNNKKIIGYRQHLYLLVFQYVKEQNRIIIKPKIIYLITFDNIFKESYLLNIAHNQQLASVMCSDLFH